MSAPSAQNLRVEHPNARAKGKSLAAAAGVPARPDRDEEPCSSVRIQVGEWDESHPHARNTIESAAEALEDADREFDPKDFSRCSLKPACVRAALSGLHFHELRRTFATLALVMHAETPVSPHA